MWNTFLISTRRYKVSGPLYIKKMLKKNVKQPWEKFSVDSGTSAAVVNKSTREHILDHFSLCSNAEDWGYIWAGMKLSGQCYCPFFYLLVCTAFHLNI